MDFVPVDMGSAQEELHTVDVLVAAVRKRDAHDTLKYACAARAGAGGRDTQSHHTCRFFGVVLRLLSGQLPLEADGLSHLKRVRKLEGAKRRPPPRIPTVPARLLNRPVCQVTTSGFRLFWHHPSACAAALP